MTIRCLFFPFTHITGNQLNTLLAFFPSFQHFPISADFKHDLPLQTLCEQGKIIPVFSSPQEISSVELKVEQYLAWAQIHKGNKGNLKSLLKNAPYFTNDTHVTAIKSQIKGMKDDPSASLTDESVLQRDGLFLKMAQLFDMQNERIDLALKDLDKDRDKLVSTLRGLESVSTETENSPAEDHNDFGAMMTRERIMAWSGCMARKGIWQQADSRRRLFVTTSKAVFDYMTSNCEDVVNTLDIDQIKVHENYCENKSEWQHQFCEYLMGVIQGDGNRKNDLPEVNDGCSLSGQMKFGFFSGRNINTLFNISDEQIPVCLIKLKG
ncbi:hypothetical protein [Desulfobacula sp.]|uniref:hypothetical protein n=1 Tax=Desulfobacula sp. TaxID=2593537 RepID=UPI00260A6E07|nr:hypothetical protein [Desulfobacula sp.]